MEKPNASWNTEDPLLKIYLRETKKYKLLSVEEEREISRRILANDPQAWSILVTSNLRFVVYLAKKFANNQHELKDYISEGNRGLMSSAWRFDYNYGCRFNTLGTWDIKQKMQGMRNLRMVVTIPRNKTAMRRQLEAKIDAFEQEHCRVPSITEISELVSMPEQKIARGLEYHGKTVSIDWQQNEVDYRNELADDSENAEQKLVKGSNLLALRGVVASLPKREATIITYAYGLNGQDPMTAAEIAGLMGYSKERIRQLKYSAEKKIAGRLKNFIDPKSRNFR